jgi:glyoxylase-like metal-dependent hydrolase (beta-lactamase superfamily II)
MKPLFALVLLSFAAHADTANTTARTVSRLGNGIYEIRHPDAPDGFPQGNTTVIVGSKAVLVVDSCLLPSSAREDVEQIRKWTQKPVTWLVNTHWHFDHTLGNATYAAAFPGVQIVAQAETRKMIESFNPGAVRRYPERQQRFQRMLDTGKDQDGKPLSPALRTDLQKAIAGLAPVVAEFKDATQLVPNLAFDRELSIDLGGREAQIRFLGRGNTAGDTVVYLPAEKLLVAGDLLDHPIPYFFGGFPVDLIGTLGKLRELEVKTIVPGHGDVLTGTAYVAQVVDLVSAVVSEVEKEMNAGLTKDQILEAAPTKLDVAGYRQKFAGADKENGDEFDVSFAGLVKTAYNQLSVR